MKLLKQLPNLLTSLNLLAGITSTLLVFEQQWSIIFVLFSLALLFDFADGLAARLLKAQSAFGKELDSLADLVSFGVFPTVLLWQVAQLQTPHILHYAVIFITLGAGLRLAKYNIDTAQEYKFLGLPTPANALWVVGWVGFWFENFIWIEKWFIPYFIVFISFFSFFIMILPLPLLAFKFQKTESRLNKIRLFFLIFAGFGLLFGKLSALPIILFLYILLSLGIYQFSPVRKSP